MRYPEIRELSCLIAYDSSVAAGTPITPVLDPTNGVGVTLASSKTYLFPFGGERYGSVVEACMQSLSATWPSGVIGTLTLEATNFPKTVKGTDCGPADVTDWDIASGKWVQINPTVGGTTYSNASGTGTWTNFSLGILVGAGSAIAQLPEFSFLRLRARFAVTTGGFFRIMNHSKLGS